MIFFRAMPHSATAVEGELAALAAASDAVMLRAEGGDDDSHLMALYSVVNKGGGDRKDSNYEDTESEYAVELRRQAYLQAIGEHGGYGNLSANGSLYGGTPAPPPAIPTMSPPSASASVAAPTPINPAPPTTMAPRSQAPTPPRANGNANASPKRAVSAFTTFGQQQQPLLRSSPTKNSPLPTTGHLV